MCDKRMVIYGRDSFSRFCDDLLIVLLKYLSFKDVMNYECVSKQWKTCVFNTRNQLCVTRFKRSNNSYESAVIELPINTITKYYQRNHKIAHKIIEILMKKCLRINSLNIDYDSNDTIMRTIINICKHITTIKFNRELNDKEVVKYLCEKFGHQLINLNFHGWFGNKYPDLLKLCANVRHITNANVSDIVCGDEVLFPRLTQVIRLYGWDKSDLMNTFVNRYANTIKVFDVLIDHNIDAQNTLLDQLSRLTNLLVLRISFYNFQEVTPHFPEKIANIGQKCRGITRLEISMNCTLISRNTIFKFSALQCYTNLTHLKLVLPYYDSIDDNMELTVSAIKNCKHLTHLSIVATITDTFFTSIHEYLPKLSVIKIINVTSNKIFSDEMMGCLAKLKELKSLNLDVLDTNRSLITEKGLNELIVSCVHIKSVSIKPMPNISKEKLIKIASKNSGISFNYYYFNIGPLNSDTLLLTDYLTNNIKFYEY